MTDDDPDEVTLYCPHGIDVDPPGGACYWCAQGDGRDDED